MSWLCNVTGIHIGGNLGISNSLANVWSRITGTNMLGNMAASTIDRAKSLVQGNPGGIVSGVTKQQRAADEAAQIAAARKAAHDAEVAQLSQDSLGSIALRKRRGGYATMLTGSPMMGSNPGSSGKTLLSQ